MLNALQEEPLKVTFILILINNDHLNYHMEPEDAQYKSPGVYIEENSSFQLGIPLLPTAVPAFIGHCGGGYSDLVPKVEKIASLPDFVALFGANCPLYYHLQLYFDHGGTDCYVVPAEENLNGLLEGMKILSGIEEPTLLVVPGATSLVHDEYGTVVRGMLQHCAEMKNRFALIDVFAATDSGMQLITQHRQDVGDVNLRYGASYFPFIKVNSEDGSKIVPASSAIAGIICRNDAEKGVWKSPANLAFNAGIEPAVHLNERQNELLNVDAATGKSINAIRAFTGRGTLIWGARTLAGNDNEWRYIAVQRFCSWVSACVTKGLAPLVFENNNQATWIKARTITENFLVTLWKQGAFPGVKPEEAFYVRAGLGETMTADDINNGRMITEIGLAVLRPAEFILLRFTQQLPPA
jgi:phage tail sheath protein FI